MPIPTDIRYAIASLSCFVDNWVHGPGPVQAIKLRELHAARIVLAKARIALDEYDARPLSDEWDPPASPAALLSHRMHARAEARNHYQVSSRPSPRMPHP